MNEDFIEYMVKKKSGAKENGIRIIFLILMLALIGTFPWLGFLAFVIAGIELFITFKFIFPLTDIEYEYLYCDKTITVDKIMGQTSRKTIGEYKLDKIEIVAPAESDKIKEYANRITDTVELWSKMESEEHKPYAVIIQGNTEIILDLPEKFVKMMQNDAPRKVFI